MEHVILLNSNYMPHDTISLRHAVKLMYRGVVEPIGNSYYKIKTISQVYLVPKVLRLINLVRHFYGTSVPLSKKNVFARDRYICAYCGKKVAKPTLEHVVPRSRGGKTSWENLVTACAPCNYAKADKLPKEAKMSLRKLPYQPTVGEFVQLKMEELGVHKFLKEVYASM